MPSTSNANLQSPKTDIKKQFLRNFQLENISSEEEECENGSKCSNVDKLVSENSFAQELNVTDETYATSMNYSSIDAHFEEMQNTLTTFIELKNKQNLKNIVQVESNDGKKDHKNEEQVKSVNRDDDNVQNKNNNKNNQSTNVSEKPVNSTQKKSTNNQNKSYNKKVKLNRTFPNSNMVLASYKIVYSQCIADSCNLHFSDQEQFMRHLLKTHDIWIYRCLGPNCNQSFATK